MDKQGQIAFQPSNKQNTNDFLKKVFKVNEPSQKTNNTESSPSSEDSEKDDEKSPEEKGLEEAVKETVKDEEIAKQKLDNLIENSNIELLKIHNSRLFNLYPDILVIDTTKVSVTFREVFGSKQVKTISIKDLTEAIIESNPFFATLKLRDARFDMEEDGHLLIIKNLRKKDAQKAHDILQGLMVAKKEEIEISKIYSEDLPDKIEQLGKIANRK